MIGILIAVCLGVLNPLDDRAFANHGCFSVEFATKNTHPPFVPPAGSEFASNIFQQGLRVLSESALVQSVVAGGGAVGLSESQQERLLPLFRDTYKAISDDSQMKSLPSALPYCLSAEQPAFGHYFLYVPEQVSEPTKTIVFLHGFGGNFLFYLKVLKSEFPDHVLVLPSWGASLANGNSKYIREVFDDIQQRYSITIRKAHLMSISGGGAISFQVYSSNSVWFTDLVVLASMPASQAIPRLRSDLNILMVNGTLDNRFPIEVVRKQFERVKQKVAGTSFAELPADHFFFLSDVSGWRTAVREHLRY